MKAQCLDVSCARLHSGLGVLLNCCITFVVSSVVRPLEFINAYIWLASYFLDVFMLQRIVFLTNLVNCDTGCPNPVKFNANLVNLFIEPLQSTTTSENKYIKR